MKTPNTRFSRTVLICALIVGTADILSAFLSAGLQRGSTPEDVLRYIARAAFGAEEAASGPAMPMMGLLFHYLIALCFTWFFFMLYPQVEILQKSALLTGLGYGIFIWLVMSQLVLPRTHVPPAGFVWKQVLISIGILVVAIGIPLAFLARRYYRKADRNV